MSTCRCQESLDDNGKGSFYYVYFDEGRGRLINVFANDSDDPAEKVEIDFLRYSCGYWDFSKKRNVKIIDCKYVFYGPCRPSHTCRAGYKFEDDGKALDLYKKINN